MANALDSYLAEIEPWAGFDLGIDTSKISAASAATRDTATAKYAVAAMREAWSALPADVRAKALDALESLGTSIAELLADTAIGDIGEAIAEQLESGAEANPILAAIVKVIFIVVDVIKAVGAIVQASSVRSLYVARAAMFPRRPVAEYVFATKAIRGFVSYRGPGSPQHRWAACLPPDRGGAHFFLGTPDRPKSPHGKWRASNGVALECDVVDGFDVGAAWGGCKAIGNTSDAFSATIVVNALSWPYWSPSYPSRPMPAWTCDAEMFKCPQAVIDPNAALVAGQIAALLSPDANFKIDADNLLFHVQAMRARWLAEIGSGALLGTIADPETKSASGFESRLTPDLAFDPSHIPTANAPRLYFDGDGLIRIYPGFENELIDLATIGMNPPSRANGETDYAMSCADFNAVLSSARSVLTVRAAFLRDRKRCAALVLDGKATEERYGAALAAAVIAGASAASGAAAGLAPSPKGSPAAGVGFAPQGRSVARPSRRPLPAPPPVIPSVGMATGGDWTTRLAVGAGILGVVGTIASVVAAVVAGKGSRRGRRD